MKPPATGADRSAPAEAAKETRSAAQRAAQVRVLRATGELVAKRGYREVSIELIAKRAQVSYSTFYKLFADKEEAFIAVYDSFIARGQEEIDAALALQPEAPWPQQLVAALRALFELIRAEPLLARACLVESLTVSREIIARYDALPRTLARLIRQGRSFSPAAAQLPPTLEGGLAGGVFWIPYQCLIAGEVDRIEALLPEAVEFVLRPYLGDQAARWAKWSEKPISAPVT